MPDKIIVNDSVPDSNLIKRGPKPQFKPEYCDAITSIASSGGHIPAMMLSIGIKSKDTWYRWQREYPEFKEAVEFAEIISQATHEEIGLQGMTGKIPNFNSTTYALIMNNKFGKDYKRNPNGSSGSSTEINITNNTMNLTSEQVQQKIAQKLEKLKSLGVDIEHTGS